MPFSDLDERIAKRTSDGDARQNRLVSDRTITEDRDTTDKIRASERRAMLRDTNTLLPVPPKLAGYHLVWLTTTNQKDPLEQRFRLGYELVKPEELPDFKISTQKSGEVTSDRIQVNEMVLAKIPEELWLQDMKTLHYDEPRDAINNLRESVQFSTDGKGRKVAYSGAGFQDGVSEGFQTLKGLAGNFNNFAGVQ